MPGRFLKKRGSTINLRSSIRHQNFFRRTKKVAPALLGLVKGQIDNLRLRKKLNARQIVFIEGGAHTGELFTNQLTKYLKVKFWWGGTRYFFKLLNLNEAKFYLFEPNPKHIATLKRYQSKYPDNRIEVINAACWVDHGKMKLFPAIGHYGDRGNTLHIEKKEKLDVDNAIETSTVHLSKYIQEKFLPDDYLILQLDIEGSEFEVIKDLLRSGVISYINELYVEWHVYCFPEKEHDFQYLIHQIEKIPGLTYSAFY